MKEVYKIWKDTRNTTKQGRFSGSLWEVSNLGHIRKNGVIVDGHIGQNGYVYIAAGTLLHRVVATLFIDNPDNKPQIDHIDGNKQNNCVDNLRWVTPSENMNNKVTAAKLSISRHNSKALRNILTTCNIGRKHMNDGEKDYFVKSDDVEAMLQKGMVFGRLRY